MDIESVNKVVQVLHRIESLASNWVLPTSSDADPSWNAYKDVCRLITVTLDDILLDRVEDDEVGSDNESDFFFLFFFVFLLCNTLVLTFIYQPARDHAMPLSKHEGSSTNTIFFGLHKADSDGSHFWAMYHSVV